MAISDRVVLLYRGRIEQCGAPREIYARPRTAYVGEFYRQEQSRSRRRSSKVSPIAESFAFPRSFRMAR